MSVRTRLTFTSLHHSLRLLPAVALLGAGAALSSAAPAFADPWYKDLPTAGLAAAAEPSAGGAPAPAQAGCLDASLIPMADSEVAGTARLCIADDGVRAQVATSNLATDNAYTAWFVYFDQPANCRTSPCMPPDATGDDPVGTLGRMDALVADSSGAGAFSGDFRGLRLSSGSQVQLPIYGHGPANTGDDRARARQLLTPEDPMLGAPGLGVPAAHSHSGAVAVAIFQVP